MTPSERNLRRRLRQLHYQIAADRQHEISRAVEFRNAHNTYMAGYHTGLADGRNKAMDELHRLMKEYPVERELEVVEP